MSDLPITLGVSEAETCCYADDVCVLARAKDLKTAVGVIGKCGGSKKNVLNALNFIKITF